MNVTRSWLLFLSCEKCEMNITRNGCWLLRYKYMIMRSHLYSSSLPLLLPFFTATAAAADCISLALAIIRIVANESSPKRNKTVACMLWNVENDLFKFNFFYKHTSYVICLNRTKHALETVLQRLWDLRETNFILKKLNLVKFHSSIQRVSVKGLLISWNQQIIFLSKKFNWISDKNWSMLCQNDRNSHSTKYQINWKYPAQFEEIEKRKN